MVEKMDSSETPSNQVASNDAEVSEPESKAVEKNDAKIDKKDEYSPKPDPDAEPEPSEAETELEKYWRAVKDNPQDFTGWTYLLQFVEQENKVPAARTAFEAFLTKYPYCYGYWKKYADMEKRNDNMDKANEVFQKGVRSIALSIELWIHYLNFIINKKDPGPDHEKEIRGLFERALAAAGTAFKSDKLWDMYILWEKDNKNLKNVTNIYDRLNALPTHLYSHHFEQLKDHINKHHPKDVLTLDEFLDLRKEVLAENSGISAAVAAPGEDDAPPGEEDAPPGETPATDASIEADSAGGDAASAAAAAAKSASDDKEIAAIREKAIENRKKVFSVTEQEVSKRWSFEEGIRRPYFHVKPLEKAQLKNWGNYLDFEIKNGTQERVMVLFERCVIACALYEEFWVKYAKYMEPISAEGVRNVYRRACTVHIPHKPNLTLEWAAFEERNNCRDEAARVIENIESTNPGLSMVKLRRIGLERRTGTPEATQKLFQEAMDGATSAESRSFYTIKYSRYLAKVLHDLPKAKEILQAALKEDESNFKLYLQLVDLEFQQEKLNETEMLAMLDQAINSPLPIEHRNAFSRRKLEYLEDFGNDVSKLLETYDAHQVICEEFQSSSKKRKADDGASSDAKRAKTEGASNSTSNGVADQTYTAAAASQDQSQPVASTSYNNYNQWGGSYGAQSYGASYPQTWGGYGYSGYGQ